MSSLRSQENQHIPAVFSLQKNVPIGTDVSWPRQRVVAVFATLGIRDGLIFWVAIVRVCLQFEMHRGVVFLPGGEAEETELAWSKFPPVDRGRCVFKLRVGAAILDCLFSLIVGIAS